MESTLAKVEEDLAAGRLGVARDRLQGLLTAYPNELGLRTRLGDVYWKLGYPREAGLYWFLNKLVTDDQRYAIDRFIKSCDSSPDQILRRLKLRVDPDSLTDLHAKQRIHEQIAECKKRGLQVPTCDATPKQVSKLGVDFMALGCFAAFGLFVVLALIGSYTVLAWWRGS